VYFAAAKAGLLLATVGAQVTLVWPPTGIALAALLLGGSRLWPGVALGATLVNASTGVSLATACGMGTGNTLEALIGAGLLRHLGVQPSLERLRDVFALVALAAGLSTIVSATIGVTSLVLGGVIPRTAAMPAWGTWWLGDALGDVVVAPAVLVWTAHCALRALPGPPRVRGGPGSGEAAGPWRTMGWRRTVEAAVLLVAVVTVSQTVFGGWFGVTRLYGLPLVYLVFPVALWATLRFGPPGAVVFTGVVSSIAIWGAVHATGPFVQGTILRYNLLNTQVFMGVVGVTVLILAAVVAERERAAAHVRALNVELEQRVVERTARLLESKEFLSVAAHELKTPVTSLCGFAQVLLHVMKGETRIDAPQVRRALQHIEAQSMKLDSLIAQLLDLSRIEAGRLSLATEVVDLTAVVADVAAAARTRTSAHTLVVDAPAPIPARLDPLRIEQVLVNLVNNAIKYSPDGGPIDIAATQHGEVAQVAVRDHGLGIPPEDRSHIFDRFYQAHARSHRSGMGLGLYISRQIIDLHGGSITADFPADGGTRFVVTLPAGHGETLRPS
jgi:signal transduction histidine kinase